MRAVTVDLSMTSETLVQHEPAAEPRADTFGLETRSALVACRRPGIRPTVRARSTDFHHSSGCAT